ncbi:hypothetical protein LAZ67_6001674 [Cordylochernes scorpioides]|uniref:Reverse transcriptase domain-containing protein n=1 Tax=Cordylochernes scorpioides TaxID=51811 RepID=A0ABY6KME2_9ARAC|nr:hypothetical protein LAZ67_6001674 [Cordylochernes scorpioides]
MQVPVQRIQLWTHKPFSVKEDFKQVQYLPNSVGGIQSKAEHTREDKLRIAEKTLRPWVLQNSATVSKSRLPNKKTILRFGFRVIAIDPCLVACDYLVFTFWIRSCHFHHVLTGCKPTQFLLIGEESWDEFCRSLFELQIYGYDPSNHLKPPDLISRLIPALDIAVWISIMALEKDWGLGLTELFVRGWRNDVPREELLSLTSRVDLLKSDIELRHQRKLDFWRMKHGFPSPPQSLPKDNIVNLTDTELSAPQISLLEKGLNFCLPKKPDLLYTVSCIEASLQHQALTDKHHIRSTITGKLLADSKKSFSLPCAVKRDLTTLKALKNQRDTIITRSDKGSQVVLMKAEDYSKKMLNILSDPNTFQEISADRVKAISGNYRASLRSLLKKGCITPEQFKLFTSNISSIPYIYGLPKTHKPDIPLRPIVAYNLSPALHLARYLSNFLKPLVKAHNIYSIQDSSDFIAKLKNFSQSGSPTMSTFDVTSLFLSLPHSLIFDGLGSLLNSPSVSNKDQKVVYELFNICLGMNTLEFNGRFFLQIRGSPMGSPLSTTAAEIVMSYLDRWPSPQSFSNAIYRIPCNDCPQSYVGETGRTIATRVLEHERNIRSHDHLSKGPHSRDTEELRLFKAGRISIEDDPRQGRPTFQRTDENVQKITDLIKENPRTTLLELEQDTGISKTTIGRIVTEDLRLKKTPAKFIPRFLTNEQKLCRLATCEDMLEMTRTDPEWKDKIITGDETWVYAYDPETKRQSAEWRGQDIAPNDFFLFPKLKAVLKGRHFDTREDIIEKSLLALKSIPKEAYKNCFDNWEKRWRCGVGLQASPVPAKSEGGIQFKAEPVRKTKKKKAANRMHGQSGRIPYDTIKTLVIERKL